MIRQLYEFWSENPVNFGFYSVLVFLLGLAVADKL